MPGKEMVVNIHACIHASPDAIKIQGVWKVADIHGLVTLSEHRLLAEYYRN